MVIRALSIRQPYAFAILHLGKRVENRERSDGKVPSVCLYRGPVLLHASKWFQPREVADQARGCLEIARTNNIDLGPLGAVTLRRLQASTGGLVGRARAIGYVSSADELPPDQRLWWCGSYALLLDNVEAFERVIPCKGALGVFTVPHIVAEEAAAS